MENTVILMTGQDDGRPAGAPERPLAGARGGDGETGAPERPPAVQDRSTWRAVVRRQNLLHLSIVMAGICSMVIGVVVAFWSPTNIGLAYMLVGEGLALY